MRIFPPRLSVLVVVVVKCNCKRINLDHMESKRQAYHPLRGVLDVCLLAYMLECAKRKSEPQRGCRIKKGKGGGGGGGGGRVLSSRNGREVR
uniref:Putative secreted protein n=1 Tax=Anopheles darlingi TaxID=43151 RepID=A0A2M4DDE7_ANODA